MLDPSSAGAVLTSVAATTDSGSASGAISILIGVAIIVAAFRWAYVARRAKNAPSDDTPAPPVRRLGADVDWWRENAGTGTASVVADADRPGTVVAPTSAAAVATPTVPEQGQSSTT